MWYIHNSDLIRFVSQVIFINTRSIHTILSFFGCIEFKNFYCMTLRFDARDRSRNETAFPRTYDAPRTGQAMVEGQVMLPLLRIM
jgi:hypothetical protein